LHKNSISAESQTDSPAEYDDKHVIAKSRNIRNERKLPQIYRKIRKTSKKKIQDMRKIKRINKVSEQSNLKQEDRQSLGVCIDRSCWENIQNLQFWFRGDFENSKKRLNRYKIFISKSGAYLNHS